MIQKLLQVHFINEDNEVKVKFTKLSNTSQVKALQKEDYFSLEDLNLEGWKLEAFTFAYDDMRLSYQIAIFTIE